MFALLGIVCFLCQRCPPGGRFPRGLAFGSHLVLSISTSSPPQAIYCDDHRDSTASWCLSLYSCGRKNRGAEPGTGRSPDCLKMKKLGANEPQNKRGPRENATLPRAERSSKGGGFPVNRLRALCSDCSGRGLRSFDANSTCRGSLSVGQLMAPVPAEDGHGRGRRVRTLQCLREGVNLIVMFARRKG
jgi:hypothetical protein